MSKRFIGISLIIIFILIGISALTYNKSAAQNDSNQNAVTDKEFETIKSNAAQKLEKVSYRSVTSEIFEGGKRFERKLICEFVPPDRKHCISNLSIIELTKTNAENSKKDAVRHIYTEWIYIGEKEYHRNGANEEWWEIKKQTNISETGGGIGGGRGFSITAEYKLTPNQFVRGQETDLYEVIISTQNLMSPNSVPSIETYKYWINKNGLFAKTQSFGIRETTVDYEYDSKIKIEAPLIKKNKLPRKVTGY